MPTTTRNPIERMFIGKDDDISTFALSIALGHSPIDIDIPPEIFVHSPRGSLSFTFQPSAQGISFFRSLLLGIHHFTPAFLRRNPCLF